MTQQTIIKSNQTEKILSNNDTILLFGHTGAGKTAQIGELAEYIFKTQGKKTQLASADRGGWATIQPYVNLGIVRVTPLIGDPFVWLNHVVQGHTYENGKWNTTINPEVGLWAFEGMTSICDAWMSWMADASSKGVNIGGGGSFNFKVGEGVDQLKIGSNNMAHYSVAQSQVFEKSTQSQYLPGTVLWTAGDKRGEDDAIGGVVGPQTAGKAQAGEVPRWFKYTFRIATEVSVGQEPKHVLYLDGHVEVSAKMAKGIANARVPLAGGDVVKVPSKLEPASLVKALDLIRQRGVSAEDEIARRLGIKRG